MHDWLIIGCGYLGQRVAKRLVDKGQSVAAVTRSAENANRFRDWGLTPIIAEITEADTLTNLPEARSVLHAVGFDRSSGKSQRTIYVDGLANVLDRIASRIERFVYISSTSVYGQSDGEHIDETSATEPTRDSGQICLDAERTVWRFFPPGDVKRNRATVLRLSGIYGPNRLLSRVETLRKQQPLPGNPEGWLNLIHVDDAATAVLATASATPGETFLITDDEPIVRRRYYGRLAELVDAPPPVFASETDDEPVRPARTAPDSLGKRCSNRKAKGVLKWTLCYPTIEEGLKNAVES